MLEMLSKFVRGVGKTPLPDAPNPVAFAAHRRIDILELAREPCIDLQARY
jgi:hypothetical protein